MITFDHIAVACDSLETGRAAIEETLGVPLQTGGQHEVFGTHNLLLGLEDGLYFELIAIDPDAPNPGRPRWFDLDHFRGLPRLTNWICRTDDLPLALEGAPDNAGTPVSLTRGDLAWDMAVPDDGILPFANLWPAMIEWKGSAHPAPRLTQQGVRLDQLVIESPDAAALTTALGKMLDDARVVIEPSARSALHARLNTPAGVRWL